MNSFRLEVACPRCGNDSRVQKISAVYAQSSGMGTVYSDARERYVSRDFVSGLGEKLGPPEKFTSMMWYFWLLLVLSGFVCGITGFSLICISPTFTSFGSGGNYVAIFVAVLGVLTLLVFLGLNILIWRYVQRRDKRTKAITERAFGKWNQLYYCSLHDIAFVPGTDIVMPSDKVQQYIFS